ncbi:MAG TPA: hypothetical protein VMV27_02255, partial [Candidatus Binataceae bacterium]|nr:hypothetical protein [Candidatus Binataceae bacterium]
PAPLSITFSIGGVSFHPAPTGVRVVYAEGYAAFFMPSRSTTFGNNSDRPAHRVKRIEHAHRMPA